MAISIAFDFPGSALPSVNPKGVKPIHATFIDLSDRLINRVATGQAFWAHTAHALRKPCQALRFIVRLWNCMPQWMPMAVLGFRLKFKLRSLFGL